MNNAKYINYINLNNNYHFPYLFLDITENYSSPFNPGLNVLHWHEDLQFVYVAEGSIIVKTLEDKIEVKKMKAYL